MQILRSNLKNRLLLLIIVSSIFLLLLGISIRNSDLYSAPTTVNLNGAIIKFNSTVVYDYTPYIDRPDFPRRIEIEISIYSENNESFPINLENIEKIIVKDENSSKTYNFEEFNYNLNEEKLISLYSYSQYNERVVGHNFNVYLYFTYESESFILKSCNVKTMMII